MPNEVQEACPVGLLSLPTEADRLALSRLILQQFGQSFTFRIRAKDPGDDSSSCHLVTALSGSTLAFYTAGFRQGSTWIWEDGTAIEPSPSGTGRCLAARGDQWIGVDCDSPGGVVCEQGQECTAGDKYLGSHNQTTQGRGMEEDEQNDGRRAVSTVERPGCTRRWPSGGRAEYVEP